MNGVYDSHVRYYRNWLSGFRSHIVNGRAWGYYRWAWAIGLTPR